MVVSFLIANGKVARPDCLRTLGLLGAVGSASTVHFGCPLPVIVKVQPSGDVPAAASSKFRVSATAFPPTNKTSMDASASLPTSLSMCLSTCLSMHQPFVLAVLSSAAR